MIDWVVVEMEKILIFWIIGSVLILGCVTPTEEVSEQVIEEELAQELENLSELDDEGLITVSSDEDAQIVEIKAVKEGENWRFPLSEYEDEFLSVGLYSDSFIKLNNSHLPVLQEEETIWITPMIKDGKGVVFNAVYSQDIDDCDMDPVKILGKYYAWATLKNGSSFADDDKWKVAMAGTCPNRLIIYMDGYFYDLDDSENIDLFRNDNTIMLRFIDLETEPKIEVVSQAQHLKS